MFERGISLRDEIKRLKRGRDITLGRNTKDGDVVDFGLSRHSDTVKFDFRGIPTFALDFFGLRRTGRQLALLCFRVHRQATGPARRRRPKNKLHVTNGALFAASCALMAPALAWGFPMANRAPVAVSDILPIRTLFGSINVLANDDDADGDQLRLVDVQAEQGTIAFSANGQLTYLADPKTGGEDEFYYTVADDRGGIAVGTIRLQKE